MTETQRDGSYPSAASPRPAVGWPALVLAIAAPVVVGYFGVVRPTATQLSLVRAQVARLESTLHDLRAKTPTAERSVGLLTRLGELDGAAARAERSLHRVDRLQDRVARSVARVERSSESLDRLDELRERVAAHTELLGEANAALATLAALPAEIETSIGRAARGPAVVARVRALRDRVEEADRLAGEALVSVDAVVETQQGLLVGADRLAAANETLDGLTRLETRLNEPLMAVDASHDRLDELVRLKDNVVARTTDLPAAFETLELMADLTADYRRAAVVFRPLRQLMADLVLLEPSIARLATLVEPIMDRSSLGALGGTELRLVLRELRRRHSETVAEIDAATAVAAKPQGTPTK